MCRLFHHTQDSDHTTVFISFMEMVEILTQNIHSLRTQNWSEFMISLKLMEPWLHPYGYDHYGSTLPDFNAVLEFLPQEQK